MAPAPPVPKPPACEAITTAAREVATGNGDEEAFISYLAQSGVLGDDLAYTAATGRMNKLIAGITHGTLGQAKKVPAVVNSLYNAWRGTTTPAAGSQMPTAAVAQAAPTAGSQMPTAASAQAAPTAGSQMPTAAAAHAAPTAGSQMPTAAAGAGSAHGGFAGGGAAQAADTAVLGAAVPGRGTKRSYLDECAEQLLSPEQRVEWERECAAIDAGLDAIDARYLDGIAGLESDIDPDAELQRLAEEFEAEEDGGSGASSESRNAALAQVEAVVLRMWNQQEGKVRAELRVATPEQIFDTAS
jgi:hypothetical protein